MQDQDTLKVENPHIHRSFMDFIMRGDKVIWYIYFALFFFSMVEIFSATSQLVNRSVYATSPAFHHISNLLLGFAALLGAQSLSLKSLRTWDKLLYFGGLLLIIFTIFFGTHQKGAARAIAGFQPVEICKLGVVMMLCTAITTKDAFFHQMAVFRTHTQGRRFWLYLILIGVIVFPLATQNLSSGIIIALASLGIMFVGKVPGIYLWKTLGVGVILGSLFLVLLYNVNQRYPQNDDQPDETETVQSKKENKGSAVSIEKYVSRTKTWAHRIFGKSKGPLWEEDINGKKSQELCAHMALADSYPFGRFIGRSKLRDFLPEAFSDYIFAIIFEEWGFIGATIIMLLYLALFIRCFMISRQTENQYMKLLMIGLPLIIVIQALMHIGVCTGAMFVTGQPLPLISRGGSSIVFTSINFGIILALTRLIKQEVEERNKAAQQPQMPEEEQDSVIQ